MKKRDFNRKTKALRIDRRLDPSIDLLRIFDLDLLQRSVSQSLLVANLFRRPATYLREPDRDGR